MFIKYDFQQFDLDDYNLKKSYRRALSNLDHINRYENNFYKKDIVKSSYSVSANEHQIILISWN